MTAAEAEQWVSDLSENWREHPEDATAAVLGVAGRTRHEELPIVMCEMLELWALQRKLEADRALDAVRMFRERS